MRLLPSLRLGFATVLLLAGSGVLLAQEAPKKQPETKEGGPTAAPTPMPSAGTPSTPAATPRPKYPPFTEVLAEAKATDGLIKTYRKGNRLFAELSGGQLNQDYIIVISIARGIGETPLIGGMSWNFDGDWLWQFRKVDDSIQIVRRNIRFQAAEGSPEEKAVRLAYTDSILFSMPIVTMGPSGGMVVDLTPIFMSDLPQISRMLPGFGFAFDRSTWAAVKGFKDNIELEVAATYASGGSLQLDTVPDSRGATINVHYSISRLPETGYRPRLADDRVGYFVTAAKNYSKKGEPDRFVRYINRWDLQKADGSSDVSPPRKPIVFWLEKTVPFKYRKPIGDGIVEWNKAFEKAGFFNAIEVRQQPDNADWDPEDINYNTFRWITSSAGFAMGPSRVNPLSGQILDTDVIFDADFIQAWKEDYDVQTPKAIAAMVDDPMRLKAVQKESQSTNSAPRHVHSAQCELQCGMARELAFGSAALMAGGDQPASEAQLEKLIMQGLKEVATHEVGHTLGLRHNFKASTVYTLDEMNDPEKTKNTGLSGSIMDYMPVNIMPKGMKQGDYFSTTIGPYDYWAIEYGYKSLGSSTEGDLPELRKIAARCAEPALAYATDEDTRGIDPDPLVNRFDMGKDPIQYAKVRAQLVSQLWPNLVERLTADGDGYQRVRRAFAVLLDEHGSAMSYAARFVGGLYVNRDHKGDPNGRAPYVVVEPARQREALTLLEEQIFSDKPFQFPPDLYNRLAAPHWSHWGADVPFRGDFPVHDAISIWQEQILAQLLSSFTLERIHDSELKVPADQDAFTTAELINRLTATIFSEADKLPDGQYTNRKPAISSLRRNLQRNYLKRLSYLAMGNLNAPDDCQTVAFAELESLEGRIKKTLEKPNLDTYSKAHLQESAARIRKVLEARLTLSSP
ncbi:MAG: zinc-dependent metalloprotease [Pirellulales bacterium]